MFQFQYSYTMEDLNALSRVCAKTYRRKRVVILRAVLAVLGIAYLGMGAIILSSGSIISGFIVTAAGMILVALCLFYHRVAAWNTRRLMMEGTANGTVSLEEECIRSKSGAGESCYPYSAVIGAYRYEGRYFLFLDKRHAMPLPERALTQGDSAALKGFLEEKINKEIIELR